MILRGTRGAEAVRRLGAEPSDAVSILRACSLLAATQLSLPEVRIVIAPAPSRAHAAARGRYLAGTVTIFPAAFADPLALAWTALHELAHAAGLDERGADAFAARHLTGPAPNGDAACSSSP